MKLSQPRSSDQKLLATWRLLIVVSMNVLCATTGCSNNNRYYADSEEALNTSGYYDVLDHIAVHYPRGIALNYPGYIVGFEETSRRKVTNARDEILLDITAYEAGYTVKRLLKTLRFDVPFVSHVMRYEGRPYGEGNCAVYSLYNNRRSAMVDICADDPQNTSDGRSGYRSAFARSWDAIDILKKRLSEDVATNKYTHLVVGIMGLDTAQEEAIRNYRSIVSSIRQHGRDEFRPIFVGVTWPSYFANRWFDPLWETFAYPSIADRADILGLTWLGVILNDAVMPLSHKIRISVIGHSFGARAASIELCIGAAILRNNEQRIVQKHPGKIDDFIGLAPAFSLLRFVDKDYVFYENVYYKDYCPKIERIALTASSNDGAFKPIFWSDMAGNHKDMGKFCEQAQPVTLTCVAATSEGNIDGYDASAKITYIDTSALMRYGMPGTKSTGHSDIYRPELGELLWTVINGAIE